MTPRRICSKECWVKRMTLITLSMVNSCAVAGVHPILQVVYDMDALRHAVPLTVSDMIIMNNVDF